MIFSFLALVQGEVAYPSLADGFYLAAYPLMATGLLLIVRRRTPAPVRAARPCGTDLMAHAEPGAVAAVSAGATLA